MKYTRQAFIIFVQDIRLACSCHPTRISRTPTILAVLALGHVASGHRSSFSNKYKYWLLSGKRYIDQSDANPCKEGIAQSRKNESEGRGFISHGRQNIFFSNEILVNVILLVLLWNLYTKQVRDVQ